MTTSAFGVEHHIEKNAVSSALNFGRDALKGARGGLSGASFGSAPGSMGGMLGAKAGHETRGGLKLIQANPGKTAALGGTGLATGGILGRKSK